MRGNGYISVRTATGGNIEFSGSRQWASSGHVVKATLLSFNSRLLERTRRQTLKLLITICGIVSLPVLGQIEFEEMTDRLGPINAGSSYGASWGDINSDGYADIYVSNHSRPSSLYLSKGDGTFTNVSYRLNVLSSNADTHGAAWADFDNDGDQDLIQLVGASTGTGSGPNQLYINKNGEFTDRASNYGLEYPQGRGRTPLWFDWNQDGRLDVFMANIERPDSQSPSALFSFANGQFTLNNSAVGINTLSHNHYAQLGLLTDNDTLAILPQGNNYPDRAYRFDTLPFTDLRSSLGFPDFNPTTDTAIADFNGDLRLDFFLARVSGLPNAVVPAGPNGREAAIVINGTEKGFTFSTSGDVDFEFLPRFRISPSQIFIGAGGTHPQTHAFTLSPANAVGTYAHNPGVDFGAFISYDFSTNLWRVVVSGAVQTQFSIVVNATNPISNVSNINFVNSDGNFVDRLLLQTGTGIEVAFAGQDLEEKTACGSVAAGDFDNDTDIDLYLVCLGAVSNLPNILYQNSGNGQFVRVPQAGGAEGTSMGRGDAVAMADYDEDGFLDLLVTNGAGNVPFSDGPLQLFRNLGNANNWLEIDLAGVISNHDGIGTRLILDTDTVSMIRLQDGGMHRFSQNQQRVHFGLGISQTADLEIRWPSGVVDHYTNLAANRIYKATEGQQIEQQVRVPPDDSGDECGQPDYNSARQKGIFIWKDCFITNLESWKVRVTGGGSATVISYQGMLSSDQDFSSLTPFRIESQSDILELTDSLQIYYDLKVSKAGQDGFDFTFPPNAEVCFNPVVLPTAAQVFLGDSKTAISAPFDLVTLGPCSPPVTDLECGQPNYSAGAETNILIWKACDESNIWYLRATAGGSQSKITYTGMLTSTLGYNSVVPFSLEKNDLLDIATDPERIDFILNMRKSGQDGFQFTFPSESNTCFRATGLPPGAKVKLGKNKITVQGAFDLDNQSICP